MRKFALLVLSFAVCTAAHADWRSDLTNAAAQKAGATVDQKLGIATLAPAGAEVYFINLKNDDTVTSPFLVQFGLKNAGVCPAGLQSPGTGHHHLLIDNPKVDLTAPLPATDQIRHFGKGQTQTLLNLKPGKHTLQLLFADWKHQPFNPSVQSQKTTITVTGSATTAP